MAKGFMVFALAGTGKTSTLEWALKGGPPKGVVLSDEQAAIVKHMKKFNRRKTGYMAFNNSIVDEASGRMPNWCEVRTCNSFAYQAWLAVHDKPQIEKYKSSLVLKDLYPNMSWKERVAIDGTVSSIVSLMKGTLTYADDPNLLNMLDYYNVDYDEQSLEYAKEVFNRSIELRSIFDFDDQFFMTLHYQVPVEIRSMLLVDESQDLNRAKQEMALRFIGNHPDQNVPEDEQGAMCVIGDIYQSIYGFTGADPESMPRLQKHLNLKTFPLTVTRRCPIAVVKQANRWVPELKAAPNAEDGEVNHWGLGEFFEYLDNTDPNRSKMVLSRVNAPLLPLAFKLLKKGKRAFIQGRDISSGITSLVKKIQPDDINDIVHGFDEITQRAILRESAKVFPDPMKLEMLEDRNQVVQVIAREVDTVEAFNDTVKSLFQDSGKPGDVRFSSVHRAKGLEAQEVSIFNPDILPYQKYAVGMQAQQEKNLAYVADTRSMDVLNYVHVPTEY